MKKLIDRLIADAPPENEGAVSLQIQLGGSTFAGAVKHSNEDGLYEMITIGQNPQTRQPMGIRVYLKADAIEAVFAPMEGEMPKGLSLPSKSGLVIPGMS